MTRPSALAPDDTNTVKSGATKAFHRSSKTEITAVATSSPIIVRRKFGAAAFGAIIGVASCGIQLATALGPSFYGLPRDAFGDYRIDLLMKTVLDMEAAGIVMPRTSRQNYWFQ